jgi:hypothetical protein
MDEILISSQRHLDSDTVEAKRDAKDYGIVVSPAFSVDGVEYRVLIDGHHSLAAAKADGVNPVVHVATATECDKIALLDESVDAYLEVAFMDDDWYNVATSKRIW